MAEVLLRLASGIGGAAIIAGGIGLMMMNWSIYSPSWSYGGQLAFFSLHLAALLFFTGFGGALIWMALQRD